MTDAAASASDALDPVKDEAAKAAETVKSETSKAADKVATDATKATGSVKAGTTKAADKVASETAKATGTVKAEATKAADAVTGEKTPPPPRSMDEIESDLAATRERLAGRIDELQDYVSPRNVAQRTLDKAKGVFVDEYGGIKPDRVAIAVGVVAAVVGLSVLRRRHRRA